MHPALRKGPVFYKKHPPIFHFFKKHLNFPLFYQKKHPHPFHFLPTGLILGYYTRNTRLWKCPASNMGRVFAMELVNRIGAFFDVCSVLVIFSVV